MIGADIPHPIPPPPSRALRAIALGNGLILAAIAWLVDFGLLVPIYGSWLDAEVEAFAVAHRVLFYLTPIAMVAGSVLGVWLARRLQQHSAPIRLLARVWAVQLAVWLVVLGMSFPAEIGGALKGV